MSRIIAHGVDLVENARIRRSLEEHGTKFIERIYTPGEASYCQSARPPRDVERYAARFAAKEAAFKALGTGWSSGIAWTDVEVVLEASGAPEIKLTRRAAEIAKALGIVRLHVSLSHTSTHAMASVIAVGD